LDVFIKYLVIRIVSSSCLIFLLIFGIKYYGIARLLGEEYEYKSNSAFVFESYLRKLENEKIPLIIKEKFADETLRRLFTLPRENLHKYKHSKDDLIEPTISILTQQNELIKNLIPKPENKATLNQPF
jgi:hypothetical protein